MVRAGTVVAALGAFSALRTFTAFAALGAGTAFTLALYAALDRIDSPLLRGGADVDALALLPSLYLVTHGPEEWFKPDLLARATAWADTIPPSALPALRDACKTQVAAVLNVTPESKKKADADTTGG